jgi:hypothetical protein
MKNKNQNRVKTSDVTESLIISIKKPTVKIPETNEFMAEFYGRANINFSQTIPKN